MCERTWGGRHHDLVGLRHARPSIGVSLYGAGKGAGISFMRHLALECARGVTANTLALGLMLRKQSAGGEESRTVTANLVSNVPVGRLGTGDDVGYTCI